MQNSFLSVNVSGDIRICSGFRREAEPGILIGNIVTDNIDDIIWRKYHHPRCAVCIKAGLTLAKGYTCKVYPDGYYDIMKENDYILEHIQDETLKKKLRLMRSIRRFEQEEYPEDLKGGILNYVEEHGLQEEVKDIALGYTRFAMKTYDRLLGKS